MHGEGGKTTHKLNKAVANHQIVSQREGLLAITFLRGSYANIHYSYLHQEKAKHQLYTTKKYGLQYYKMQDKSQQFGEKVTTSGNCYLRKCQLALLHTCINFNCLCQWRPLGHLCTHL